MLILNILILFLQKFAEIRANELKNPLLQKYNVTEFPKIIVLKMKKNKFKQIAFSEKISIQNLIKFLGKYARIIAIMRKGQEYKDFPQIQKIAVNEYQTSITKSENYVLIHLKGKQSHQALPELMAKFENLFEYFELDCTKLRTKNFIQNELDVDSFPSLVFIHAEEKETIDVFSRSTSSYEVIARINELTNDRTYHIQHHEAKSYLEKIYKQDVPTIIYFSKNEDDMGIIFKSCALLSKFSTKINFARAIDAPYDFMTLYKINRRNDLVAILGQKKTVLHFTEIFSSQNVLAFLYEIIAEFNNADKKQEL